MTKESTCQKKRSKPTTPGEDLLEIEKERLKTEKQRLRYEKKLYKVQKQILRIKQEKQNKLHNIPGTEPPQFCQGQQNIVTGGNQSLSFEESRPHVHPHWKDQFFNQCSL